MLDSQAFQQVIKTSNKSLSQSYKLEKSEFSVASELIWRHEGKLADFSNGHAECHLVHKMLNIAFENILFFNWMFKKKIVIVLYGIFIAVWIVIQYFKSDDADIKIWLQMNTYLLVPVRDFIR